MAFSHSGLLGNATLIEENVNSLSYSSRYVCPHAVEMLIK